jgi:HEAT repeat protein
MREAQPVGRRPSADEVGVPGPAGPCALPAGLQALCRLLVWPLALAAALSGCGAGEPVQDGKPLSAWVRQAQQVRRGDAPGDGFPERQQAFAALVKIGPPAVPALAALLRESATWDVRWKAAEALGEIGPAARDAVPALADALRDGTQNWVVRVAALRALARVAGADAVAPVRAALRDRDPCVRLAAALELGGLGPPARSAAPALRRALTDEDEAVRDAAARALRRLGGGAGAPPPACRPPQGRPDACPA